MLFSSEHSHNFSAHNQKGEQRTVYVLILTVTAMIAEIVAGTVYGSMALLADGWHMGTHAAAFCITLFAYRYAKKHENSGKFSFGAGKVSVLGGYTSAIALGIVALMMVIESVNRLFHPQDIQFNEAIMVAIVGLIVNVVSMYLLHDHHDHSHHHDHQSHEHTSLEHTNDDHSHGHHDHNLRAAYLHVFADTLTSLLAIVALLFGKYLGWNWLDAVMGIVGAIVIAKWTIGLMKQTSPILLDESSPPTHKQKIIDALSPWAKIKDLHIWKVSSHHYSAAIILESDSDKTVQDFKDILARFDSIHHLTLELNPRQS